MNRNAISGIVGAIVVLLAGAWAWGFFDKDYSDDPEVAKVEKLRDQKFSEPDAMSDEQLRTAGAALKQQAAGLSPEQKKNLWESSMPLFMPMIMRRAEAEMDKFLALTPEEQRREMDKKINDESRGNPRKGGEFGGGKPKRDPAKMAEFMKKLNDYTTPEQRAKFDLIITLYKDRKNERGL